MLPFWNLRALPFWSLPALPFWSLRALPFWSPEGMTVAMQRSYPVFVALLEIQVTSIIGIQLLIKLPLIHSKIQGSQEPRKATAPAVRE